MRGEPCGPAPHSTPVRPPPLEEGPRSVLAEGSGEQKALGMPAPESQQVRSLSFGLHSLGDRSDPYLTSQGENRFHHSRNRAVGGSGHPADEAAVDLEQTHREVLQVAEGGVPRSEIVEADPYSQIIEP